MTLHIPNEIARFKNEEQAIANRLNELQENINKAQQEGNNLQIQLVRIQSQRQALEVIADAHTKGELVLEEVEGPNHPGESVPADITDTANDEPAEEPADERVDGPIESN